MFLLALQLGRTVAELEQTLTHNELMEWRVIFEDTHFGELRADRRNAELLAMLYNINRAPNKPAITSDVYMPYKVKKRDLTDEQLKAKSRAFFSSLQ